MVDRMKEFFKPKIIDKSKSEVALPKGKLELEIYNNYYDSSNTITTAQASDPLDPDNSNYNRERIFVVLERNSPFLWVANDAAAGGATLFVICSHGGEMQFSDERPIYPQQFKVYYNVYELRLRSAATIAYRVSEYELGQL